jgi:hypothetical protein
MDVVNDETVRRYPAMAAPTFVRMVRRVIREEGARLGGKAEEASP